MPPTLFGSRRTSCRLFAIMAVFLSLIMLGGCGPEGGGDASGGVPGESSGDSSDSDDPNSGGTDGADFLSIQTMNQTKDANGKLLLMGEVMNTGQDIIYALSLAISIINDKGEILATYNCYPVSGRIVQHTMLLYNHFALAPGDVGVFWVVTALEPEDMDKYTVDYYFKTGELGKTLKYPASTIEAEDFDEYSTDPGNQADGKFAIRFKAQVEGSAAIYGPYLSVVFRADRKVVSYGQINLSDPLDFVFYPGDFWEVAGSSGLLWADYRNKMEYDVYPMYQMSDTRHKSLRKDEIPGQDPASALVDEAEVRHGCLCKSIDEEAWHACPEPEWEGQTP